MSNTHALAYRTPLVFRSRNSPAAPYNLASRNERLIAPRFERALRCCLPKGRDSERSGYLHGRAATIVAAQRNADGGDVDENPASEIGVILRLAAISFAGAAFVKYGELLLGELPYSHSLSISLTMIIAPCVIFSAFLAFKSR